MRQRLYFALALFALVLAIATLFLHFSSSSEKAAGPENLGAEKTAESASGTASPAPGDTDEAGESDPAADKKRARYQELHRRLTRAREAREEAESEEKAEGDAPADEEELAAIPPLPRAGLQKEYIQEQMQEIVPLIKECYEVALEQDPQMGGKIVVEFVIIGEEEIGGLVESSQVVAEKSDVKSPPFLECVQETMYAIELDAPEGGGSTTIRYPFNFASASGD